MKTYDERHPYAIHTPAGTKWLGDPARGEFAPKDKQKRKGSKR